MNPFRRSSAFGLIGVVVVAVLVAVVGLRWGVRGAAGPGGITVERKA